MRRCELCLRAFPRAWRERYGDELRQLLAESPGRPWSQCLDLVVAGLGERVRGRSAWVVRAAVVMPAAVAAIALLPAALSPGTSPLSAGTPLAVVSPRHTSPSRPAADVRRPVVAMAAPRAAPRRAPARATTAVRPAAAVRSRTVATRPVPVAARASARPTPRLTRARPAAAKAATVRR